MRGLIPPGRASHVSDVRAAWVVEVAPAGRQFSGKEADERELRPLRYAKRFEQLLLCMLKRGADCIHCGNWQALFLRETGSMGRYCEEQRWVKRHFWLFVSQRFDRVELRRPQGRHQSADHSHQQQHQRGERTVTIEICR